MNETLGEPAVAFAMATETGNKFAVCRIRLSRGSRADEFVVNKTGSKARRLRKHFETAANAVSAAKLAIASRDCS